MVERFRRQHVIILVNRPADNVRVKISKDLVTGGIQWESEADVSSSSGQSMDQPSAQDADVETVDAVTAQVDDTDPVDDTDAVIDHLASMNLNEMD